MSNNKEDKLEELEEGEILEDNDEMQDLEKEKS